MIIIHFTYLLIPYPITFVQYVICFESFEKGKKYIETFVHFSEGSERYKGNKFVITHHPPNHGRN